MCRVGKRCSKYASETLEIVSNRHEKVKAELSAYTEKYADTLEKSDDLTKSDLIHQHKHQRLVEFEAELAEKRNQAKFEYYSTPVGQAELEKDILDAREAGNEELAVGSEQALEYARKFRIWQRDSTRELKEIEETDGIEAAEAEALRRVEALDKLQEEQVVERERLEAELETLNREESDDEKIQKELEEKEEKEKLAEEEKITLEQARKRRRNRIILISALVSAVAVYALIMNFTSGQKSQMLQYAKSAGIRRGIASGQKFIAGAFKGK